MEAFSTGREKCHFKRENDTNNEIENSSIALKMAAHHQRLPEDQDYLFDGKMAAESVLEDEDEAEQRQPKRLLVVHRRACLSVCVFCR